MHSIVVSVVALLLAGCALVPSGTQEERDLASTATAAYAAPPAERTLPELPLEPTWRDVLRRSLLANGELEAAVHQWAADVARVDQAASWPNSNVALSFETMFSEENVKAFDRTTFRLGFDSMESLAFPTKAMRAGEVALDEARASGERARDAKFALQERVLSLWADYTLTAESLRASRESLRLRTISARTAAGRAAAGDLAQATSTAELALRLEEDRQFALEADLRGLQARLNAVMARDPDAPLVPPTSLPEPRPMPVSDDRLIALAAENNPNLAAIAHDAAGRQDALELARQRWIPDINPAFGFTGSVAQFLGAAVSLPTTVAEIRGAVREAESRARASEAMLAQARRDEAAELVAILVALRDADRRVTRFREHIVPVAERASGAARQAYAGGATPLPEVLDAEESLLQTRLVVARTFAEREKLLARTERLIGIDLETLEKDVP